MSVKAYPFRFSKVGKPFSGVYCYEENYPVYPDDPVCDFCGADSIRLF